MSNEADGSAPEYSSWKWNEGDWQRYLLITDTQIRNFSELYQIHTEDPRRLDKIAERMGWTTESWQSGEVDEETQAALPPEDLPYTMHLHPVYTVTRALFRSLYDLALSYAKLNPQNTVLQLAINTTLHEAETQALLGLESQDMGDMALTVCHFKRSLTQINHALKLLNRMEDEKMAGAELFAREVKKRLFDLREIWLRVNSEMREEIQRRDNGAE